MKNKSQTGEMFNAIAPTYDFLNRFLSLRTDMRWRRKAIDEFGYLYKSDNILILDVACGTADMAIIAAQKYRFSVIGIDISQPMIDIGLQKIRKKALNDLIDLRTGSAENTSFPDAAFDGLMVAFGVRNFENRQHAYAEFFRVMKPQAKLVVLEFGMPVSRPLKSFYLFYFRNILPFIGGLISGNKKAYKYLNRSAEEFPCRDAFTSELKAAGFIDTAFIPLSGGIAYLYIAIKP